MPPKKKVGMVDKPTSADQVTSVRLKELLVDLGAKPIPALKADRWTLYVALTEGKGQVKARPKGQLKVDSLKVASSKIDLSQATKESLTARKAFELKTLAKSLGDVRSTKKAEYVAFLLSKKGTKSPKKKTKSPKATSPSPTKPRAKPPRRVNVRRVIKGPKSMPPAFLTAPKGCLALINDQELLDHQTRVIDHFQKHSGLIAYHLPGSGKTLTAAAASLCWLKEHPEGAVLVAVPGPLIDNFIEKGLKKFYGLSHNFVAKHFVVDTFVKLPKYVSENGLDQKPFFLIVDEAHKLKAKISVVKRGAKKGAQKGGAPKGVLELAGKAQKVLVMSGTIFRNSERDLENLVAIARGPEDGGVVKDIFKLTGTKNKDTKKWEFDPVKVRKYFECLVSYYEGDPTKYPNEVDHLVKVEMPKPYWNRYWQEHLKNKGLLGKTSEKKEFYVNKMRMATNKFLEESPKADEIVKIIKKDPTKKTLIYSFFKDSGVAVIQKKLKAAGIASNYLRGDMTPGQKSMIVDTYNDAVANDVAEGQGLVIVTQATSEGLDFKGTRRVIIMEKAFSSAAVRQIVARGSRYKSHEHLPLKDRKVDIYFLELKMPKGVPRPGPDENSGQPFKLMDERIDEIIEMKDMKERNLMSWVIGPQQNITIERDPKCY
jgi:hypothetical protein